jgi:hypothetical protein
MSEQLFGLIESTLKDRELEFSRKEGGHFVVDLPGENKLKTTTLLTVGTHGLRVEAFVCRKPDENFEGVYRYLLRRNRRLYGVAYTLDKAGDIYLVGRIAEHAVTSEELDAVLGQVLEAADHDFNIIVGIGFLSSIKREWECGNGASRGASRCATWNPSGTSSRRRRASRSSRIPSSAARFRTAKKVITERAHRRVGNSPVRFERPAPL